MDNYFKNREDYPRDENGKLDMEALECVDIEKFNEDMNGLLNGRLVEIPRFNFVTGTREYNGDFLKLGKNDVLIVEGIHCLNDKLSYSLPAESRFKIYISALTQLNVDEHNRIPTADGRIIRRMVRDARTRGTSALETIRRWSSVRRGEDKNIFPRDVPEYDEAKRLLKFLDYFLGIDSEIIPKNSIIREFIGGSCLKV